MSKLKTIVITGITTLATIGAGLTAVAFIPSVKNNLSVSVKDKIIYGAEASNNKLQAELTAEKEKVAELTATKNANENTILTLNNDKANLQNQVKTLNTEIATYVGRICVVCSVGFWHTHSEVRSNLYVVA